MRARYFGAGFRRGLSGVCLVDPLTNTIEDSVTGAPCDTPAAAVVLAPPIAAVPCLSGSGPLSPGQSYCYGNTPSGFVSPPAAGAASSAAPGGVATLAIAGAIVLVLFIGLGKR